MIKLSYILFAVIFILSSCSFNHFFYFTSAPFIKMDKYADNNNITYEDLFITNKKNKKLHGVVLKPLSVTPKACILFLHGNGGNVSTWIDRAAPFAENGYQVLLFDYQGYGKSEGKPTHKNLLHDSELFLDYLEKETACDELKLIVIGQSLGGNLAVEIAKRNQNKVDLLIIEGAFSSHKDIAIRFVPKTIKPLAKLLVHAPYSSNRSIRELKNMQKLIVHSYEDQVCPISMGEQLFHTATEPKELWRINGAHCRGIFYHQPEYLRKTDSLLLRLIN